MEFRDLKRQYEYLKPEIDMEIKNVLSEGNFISGSQVLELEQELADYVNVKHCITCGNGTDAMSLAWMVWNIGPGDAVFVPDFTFFSTGETVAYEGAKPIFVDVDKQTFNMSPDSLEEAIEFVLKEGKWTPKAIVSVDLFGLPADYGKLKAIAEKYHLYLLEDGAQGFGGERNGQKALSFGDISTTSFFPAKPLGCYGDGGAVFTENDEWAELIRSYRIHGKGKSKYDNVRIGINSRLDTLQAAVLKVKLKAFAKYELEAVNQAANLYHQELSDLVQTPITEKGSLSSWAQYSILLEGKEKRDHLKEYLQERKIPTMIYYPKPMHLQKAFHQEGSQAPDLSVTEMLCNQILSLPMHPYLKEEEIYQVTKAIRDFFETVM